MSMSKAMSRARLAGALALVMMGAAGCGGGGTPSSAGQPTSHKPTVRPTVGSQCPSDWQDKGKQVWFEDAKGVSLGGIELGTGTTGIVLSHQAGRDACSWMPYAKELADAGYRVVAYDFAGSGVSDEPSDDDTMDANVLGAVAFLRKEGATTIVLMGESMGAAASIVAGSEASPKVAGVVSLSSPQQYHEQNAIGAAKQLSVPVLYIAGSDDQGFAGQAQSLYTATPGTAKAVVIVDSVRHGAPLLAKDAPEAAKARAAVTDFLNANAKV
jgi:pimeloyl-ACP methyl ester carboxylesterase